MLPDVSLRTLSYPLASISLPAANTHMHGKACMCCELLFNDALVDPISSALYLLQHAHTYRLTTYEYIGSYV